MADRPDAADRSRHFDDEERARTPRPFWIMPGQTRTIGTPCLRASHSLAAFSNRIYLFGGYCDYASYVASSPPNLDQLLHGARPGIGIHFNSLHEFCLDTAEWRVLHPGCHPHEARGQALPKPRRHASMVVHGRSLYVYGGFDVDDNVLPDLWEFRVDSGAWFPIPLTSPSPQFGFPMDGMSSRRPQLPLGRAEHTAIVEGSRMIVFGGYDGKKKLNDTYVFNFATLQWYRPSAADCNAPSRRCKHSAVLYKRKMYVVGGFQFYDGDNYAFTDMHVLDLDTFSWSKLQMSRCPEALQGHKAVVCGDSMFIIGGKVRLRPRYPLVPGNGQPASSGNVNTEGAPNTVTMIGLPHTMGDATAAGDTPNSVGLSFDNRSSGLNANVFRYTFDSNEWSCVESSGPVPIPRQLHSAVALPTGVGKMSIFMFGGTDRSKQRFFYDLCELRGIRTNSEVVQRTCETCSGTKSLLDNEMFSDVKFIVGGKTIHAHRCVLYARAEYFRNMFDSKMRETCEKEIQIPDVAYEVFLAVLEYLYSGTVNVSNGKLSVELLKAADMFQIEGLRNLCVEKVEQAVTVENAASICQVADMHNALNLKQFCITFMMQNFRDVICSQSFQNLMRRDPGGLGREILEAYSDNSPQGLSGAKRPRK